MSNILFVGPYRQRNIDGIWSRALIHNIISDKNHSVQIRPIFIDNKCAIENTDTILKTYENNRIQNFDTVIQHTTLDSASPIHAIKKNVLIPIVTSNIVSNSKDHLSKFDSIVIDNKHDSVRLLTAYPFMQKMVKNIDYMFTVEQSVNGSFNTGLLETSEKLYTILNYRLNIRTIYDIVVSFIANIKSKNVALILYTLDITSSEKTELENFIQETYKSMGVLHTISKVMVAPITSDLTNIYIAHKSGDVFIDAVDYGSNSINIKIAAGLNKPIIKIDPDYGFSLTDSGNLISANGSYKLSSQSINSSIRKYIENKITTNNSSLFKTTHISKCI